MTIERGLRLIAGTVVLLSVACLAPQSVLDRTDGFCRPEPVPVGLHELVPDGLVAGTRGHEAVRRWAEVAAYCHRCWRTDNEVQAFKEEEQAMDGKAAGSRKRIEIVCVLIVAVAVPRLGVCRPIGPWRKVFLHGCGRGRQRPWRPRTRFGPGPPGGWTDRVQRYAKLVSAIASQR